MDIKKVWYRIVASALLKDRDAWMSHYETMKHAYIDINNKKNALHIDLLEAQHLAKDWEERAMLTNKDGAIAVQVIRERLRNDDVLPSVLSAREHATKQRIRELESEVERLRTKIVRVGLHVKN